MNSTFRDRLMNRSEKLPRTEKLSAVAIMTPLLNLPQFARYATTRHWIITR